MIWPPQIARRHPRLSDASGHPRPTQHARVALRSSPAFPPMRLALRTILKMSLRDGHHVIQSRMPAYTAAAIGYIADQLACGGLKPKPVSVAAGVLGKRPRDVRAALPRPSWSRRSRTRSPTPSSSPAAALGTRLPSASKHASIDSVQCRVVCSKLTFCHPSITNTIFLVRGTEMSAHRRVDHVFTIHRALSRMAHRQPARLPEILILN